MMHHGRFASPPFISADPVSPAASALLLMVLRSLLAGLAVAVWLCAAPVTHAQTGAPADSVRTDTTQSDTSEADTTRTDTTQVDAAQPDTTGGRAVSADTSGGPGRPSGTPPSGTDGPGRTGQGGGVNQPVTLTSRDSLVITFNEESGDIGTLYGDSKITYEDATLQARVVEMNFDRDQVTAYGRRQARPDTAAAPPSPPETVRRQRIGNVIGRPEPQRDRPDSLRMEPPSFQRGNEQSFTGSELSFNLATNRGRVVSARTQAQQRSGFVTGRTVKVYEDSTLFVQDGSYTTCDCEPDETPSYSLRSDRMKVRGEWVYTGPIQMYLFEVPTPLWLPFGFLPNTQGRRSGPLPPQYGQDERGLYLRDWGWYFAMNDYVDLTLRAGIWSQGSFEILPRFRYAKRYRYSGNLRLEYQRERIGEPEDPSPTRRQEGRLGWSHSQTLSPTASLNGNVNLVTSGDYLQDNATNVNDAVRQTINSTIRYRKQWPGGDRSLSISAQQNQQLSTGAATVGLPSLNFTQGQFKPFRDEQNLNDPQWYEKVTLQYDLSFENRYSFTPRSEEQLLAEGDTTAAEAEWYDALFNPDLYRRATGNNEPPLDPEMTHSIPISASYRISRFNLNVTPNARYTSNWYLYTKRLERVERQVEDDDPSTPDVDESRIDTVNAARNVQGFYSEHRFNTSVNLSTEVFGIFPVKAGPFEGLLHRISPSLSLTYTPNFNDPFWGQTRVLEGLDGEPVLDRNGREQLYNIRSGRVVGQGNQQLSLGFRAGNEFETKRVRVDSTGERDENRVKFLDMDVSTSYDFAADSLNLADVQVNARTTIADLVNVQSRLTMSPYEFVRLPNPGSPEPRYEVVNEYEAASTPWKPLRFTDLTLSMSMRLTPDGLSGGSNRSMARSRPQSGARAGTPTGRSGDPYAAYRTYTGYPQFATDWNLELDLTYSLSKPFVDYDRRASMRVSGGFAATPKWRITVDSSLDLVETKLRQTNFSVSRDLGCWSLSLGWSPIGRRQYYSFRLAVNQGMLSNLLRLDIPRGGDSNVFRDIGSRVGQSAAGAAGGGPGRF
jgi:hypothetical protein